MTKTCALCRKLFGYEHSNAWVLDRARAVCHSWGWALGLLSEGKESEVGALGRFSLVLQLIVLLAFAGACQAGGTAETAQKQVPSTSPLGQEMLGRRRSWIGRPSHSTDSA